MSLGQQTRSECTGRRLQFVYVLCVLLITPCSNAQAPASAGRPVGQQPDGPQLRGTAGQELSAAKGPPVSWSGTDAIRWKTRVPGSGWSSPVTDGTTVWLTSCLVQDNSLWVYGIDFATGEIRHEIEVIRKPELGGIHEKNTHATPTIALMHDRLIAHFGTHGTVCLSTSGRILWKSELVYYHHHGPGSSPVVDPDQVYLICDGYTGPFYDQQVRLVADRQFVAALEISTGNVVWKKNRPGRHAYATPLLVKGDAGSQLISPGGDRVVAYDPVDGREVWWCGYDGYSLVARPVIGHGLVLISTGYDVPTLLAIRIDGHGDVTNSHVAWRLTEGAPLNSSPIIVGEEVYFVSDNGVAQCLDVHTGARHWRNRLTGNHSSSPLYADGMIYFTSETGGVQVIRAGKEFDRVARNRVNGRSMASPAVYGKSLLFRTDRFLYRLDKSAP